MHPFSILVVLTWLAVLATGGHGDSRIVGGEPALPGQFKFIASLRIGTNERHFCGSSIIGKRAILTAAHCKVTDSEPLEVLVGSTQLNDTSARRYRVQSFVIHEDYDPSTLSNDVAVVTVAEDIDFNDLVQPIALAAHPIEDNQRVTSAGWGLTSYPGSIPNDLQWMQMDVLSSNTCRMFTGEDNFGKICTLESQGHGVCSGDSGGPLINSRNQLVGITSAAYLCALGKPDIFTDVHWFKNWIVEHSSL